MGEYIPGSKLMKGGLAKPSIVPAPGSNPDDDAEMIKKATKGIGTDEGVLITVLCKRSNEQRQKIKAVYQQKFGEDMVAMLKKELSGNFEDTVVALMEPKETYEANCLRKAMKGAGTDELTLIDIICTKTNKEIQQLKAAYNAVTQRNLEKDIESELSSDLKRLIISNLAGSRDESTKVDVSKVGGDAKKLYDAGARKLGTDEAAFNDILCRSSPTHISAIIDEYKKMSGKSLLDAIADEFSGKLKEAYYALLVSLYNKPAYFAYALYKSMKGAGTNDSRLVRLIVSRSEIDLDSVKPLFEKFYAKSLEDWITSECSGDYKKALCAIARGNRDFGMLPRTR